MPEVDVHISLDGRAERTAEIYRQLRTAVSDGRLPPGARLPSSRELATRLGVARSTVVAAYEQLAGEGFVRTTPGAGTFVERTVLPEPDETTADRSPGALAARPSWDAVPLPTAFDRRADFDFRTGLADTSHFPYRAWRRLSAEVWSAPLVGRGVYGDPAGHPELREAIATHIGVSRNVLATAEDVIVTNGTQQALDLIARVLLAPGDVVAVEDPGYELPSRLFRSLDLEVVPVPVDDEGIAVDALPPTARAVYVTPSHQYPLGVAMSLDRRRALLEWAGRHDAAVIEDDYDSEFRYGGLPIDPLHALDTEGRVLLVGSFSKTLLPTLRIGFVAVPPSLRHAVRAAKYLSDWHTAEQSQRVLARFITDGLFAGHLRRMRRVYEERHRTITAHLRQHLAGSLDLIPSRAGIHLAARTWPDVDVRAVVERAHERSVAVQSFRGRSDPRVTGLTFGYGAIATGDIAEGLDRLGACLSG